MKPAAQVVVLVAMASVLIIYGFWCRHAAKQAESDAGRLRDLASPAGPADRTSDAQDKDASGTAISQCDSDARVSHFESMVSFAGAAALLLWAIVTAIWVPKRQSSRALPTAWATLACGTAETPQAERKEPVSLLGNLHPAALAMFGLLLVSAPFFAWYGLVMTQFILLAVVIVLNGTCLKPGKNE